MNSIGRFEVLADRFPDRIAVVDGVRTVSYGALEERSNQLARLLVRSGMGPQSIACIYLPTGIELVVAVLAAAKTGGAFLIVSSDLPAARKRMMVEECEPRVTIGPHGEEWLRGVHTIVVDPVREAEKIRAEERTRPGARSSPGNLAYLFYTSGSTGESKAVMVPWLKQSPPGDSPPYPGGNDRHLLKSSTAFTLIIREIFQPLTSGGRTYLLPAGKQQDPEMLLDAIIAYGITLITVVPSLLRVMLASPKLRRCRSLRYIDCIGEALPPDLRIAFQAKLPVPIGVTYGCTEAPSATARVFEPGDSCSFIDLGRPKPGRSVYVLDNHLNKVPPGEAGQIYVSGKLASGYFKRPRLTAEKFIPDPHSTEPGVLMYCTGDLGRYTADGSLIYLGRGDDQVQIGGQRVEPAEIEKAISSHPDVEHASVLACSNAERAYLSAFVATGDSGLDVQVLADYCRARLPRYMVPSRFSLMPTLPLLPSGKVHRQKLLEDIAHTTRLKVGPANDLEARIYELWGELFGHTHFGVTDDLFGLGGDSLMAAELAFRLDDELGIPLSPAGITQGITIRSIAAAEPGRQENPGNVIRMNRSGGEASFFAVHGEGNIYFYGRLARLLQSSCQFYAIQAYGLDRAPVPFRHLEDCAEDYAAQIRHYQRSGPYCIGGYCFGGVIAYEMARQLHESGHEVPLLVLFDTGPTEPVQDDDRIHTQNRTVLAQVRALYQSMIREYHPKPYAGRVILIQSADLKADVTDRPAMKQMLDMAAGGCEIYRIDDHDGFLFDEPCVTWIGNILTDRIARAGLR